MLSFCSNSGGGIGGTRIFRRLYAALAANVQCEQVAKQCLYEDDEHILRTESISGPAWRTLINLRTNGYEALIVGGTIRDLLLSSTPKDFDILTSAELQQVKRLFGKCQLVGKKFPIAQVHIGGTTIEVSSWSTGSEEVELPDDAACLRTKLDQGEVGVLKTKKANLWSKARESNALVRDFTVNALLYDPFSRVIFDYVGGMDDIRDRTLRTVIDPYLSFMEDPARMLRAIRLAARVGLNIESQTANALRELGAGVLTLPSLRLTMEINSLMAYGSAAQSIKFMWHFNILEQLLPMHAKYLQNYQVSKDMNHPSVDANFLFQLLKEIDQSVHTSNPADPSLYMAALACPLIADKVAALNSSVENNLSVEVSSGEQQMGWQSVSALPMAPGQPYNYRNIVTTTVLEMVRSSPTGFDVILPYGAAGDAVELLLAEYAARSASIAPTHPRQQNTFKRLEREYGILSNALTLSSMDWVNKSTVQVKT